MRSGRCGAREDDARRALSAGGRSRTGRGPNTVTMASSSSDCLTGLLRYAAKPASSARARPCGRPADVSMISVAPESRESALTARAKREAVDVGHHGVRQHEPKRVARRGGVTSAASAARAPSTDTGFIRQLVSISSRMRRLVALSSTTSTRRSCRSADSGGSGCVAMPCCSAEVRDEMEPRPSADLALDPDAPAHQLDQLRGDRQARGRCRRSAA